GVVAMPTTGELLAGRVDLARPVALREDAQGRREPLAVSSVSDPKQARMMVSRSHRPAIVGPAAERLGITQLLPCGSVGVKVSRVVTAHAEVYLHGGRGPKSWDTCAPEAILRAAGGRFTELTGGPLV